MRDMLAARIRQSAQTIAGLQEHVEQIEMICADARRVLDGGGAILTAGNGGSAAQALHLAEELIGRYRAARPPYRAICLNADPTALTCIANDFGFEQVFARQCEALAGPDDLLLVLSTSGKSPNIVGALEMARRRGAITVGLLGRDGGPCRSLCDRAIVVASDDSAHAQEAHQVIIHLLCESLERSC